MRPVWHCLAAAALALLAVTRGDELASFAAQHDFLTSLTNDAIDLAEGGDLEQALALFRQAAEQSPGNGKVRRETTLLGSILS